MSDTYLHLVGNLVADADPPQGAGPAKFRMACYAAGSGDNRKTAFVRVAWFRPAPDALAQLTKGRKVEVTGRFDPWENKEGQQVLDVMAETVSVVLFTERNDDNGNGSQRQPARTAARRPAPAPAYDQESF